MVVNLNTRLATWVHGLQLDDLPPEVIDKAKLQVLDALGVMWAARTDAVAQAAAQAIAQTDPGTQARALGFESTLSLGGAAFVNGVLAGVLEFDDTHMESYVHPTVSPLAIGLAYCTSRGLGGADLLLSTVIGSELSCRLGLVPPVRLHSQGIHPTAIMGAFGATYALAKLAGLGPDRMASAVGHCASMCGGVMASWEDGSSTKTLHVGMAASQAVRSVALAQAGVAGPVMVLDGRFGWFRSHLPGVAQADLRFGRAGDRLGEHWELLEVASKVYPNAFTIHAYVDALLAIKAQHDVPLSEIEEIRFKIGSTSVPTVCEPLSEKLRPRTSWQGRISLQHSLAEAWVRGKLDKTAYSPQALQDPQIQALAARIKYEVDPAIQPGTRSVGAHVMLRLKSGALFEHVIESVRGARNNPMSQGDYVRKFRSNVEGILSTQAADRCIAALLNLEHVADLGEIVDHPVL